MAALNHPGLEFSSFNTDDGIRRAAMRRFAASKPRKLLFQYR